MKEVIVILVCILMSYGCVAYDSRFGLSNGIITFNCATGQAETSGDFKQVYAISEMQYNKFCINNPSHKPFIDNESGWEIDYD